MTVVDIIMGYNERPTVLAMLVMRETAGEGQGNVGGISTPSPKFAVDLKLL